MKFYILSQNMDIEGIASVVGVPEGIDPGRFIKGSLVDENDLPEHIPDNPRLLDLHPRSGSYRGDIISGLVTLFHKCFIEVLDSYGLTDVQYFPVGLRDKNTGKLEGGYSIVNPLARIKALDLENSEYELDSFGNPDWITSFTIDEEATRGIPIFILDEDPTLLIINEHLANFLIEKDKLSEVKGLSIIETKYHEYDPE